MHTIKTWEASRSGAGITVAMTDAGGVKRKQFVKKIEGEDGAVVAIAGDGARFHLCAGRDTSAEVATIAGRILSPHRVFPSAEICDRLIEAIAHANSRDQAHAAIRNELTEIDEGLRQLAASALGQHG